MDLAEKPVAISEEYLTKIADELVHNAFKFSKAGKPVKILLASADTDNALTLSISDEGRGLETEHIRKVGAYMQFERKLQEQQGLGLGLIIAKRLTELHGGSLVIQSELGKGTTVVKEASARWRNEQLPFGFRRGRQVIIPRLGLNPGGHAGGFGYQFRHKKDQRDCRPTAGNRVCRCAKGIQLSGVSEIACSGVYTKFQAG